MTAIYRSAAAHRDVERWCTDRLARWPVSHRTMALTTCAGRTHVVAAGEEAGPQQLTPRVVVVPGTNFNAAASLPLVTALAARWPTYAVDVPGQPGLSSAERPGQHRLVRYGQWLQEVLDEISPGPTVVVGHSLGGGIALACDVPQLIGRVLASPAGLTRLKVTGRVLAATLPWLARPTEARSATLLRQMHGPDRQPSAELVTWMNLLARSCRSSLAPAPLPDVILARSRRVTNVVATGEHDVFLPPSRLTSPASRHLGVVVDTVPDAGHLVVEEHPETIVTMVAALIGTGRA
ncbi:alpha/beta fold hydrolase [Streptomyces sioyaensis]|uniref:Alpha/beta hydrolase n=1 Tax=Streptomyces sioyaensis TaxID=67364 RepID=A0A4Q1RC62_9ACTN|nr:alpha/beta hydrolase [Streptomyces sioyaensis]MBM4795705.1 alpha/beta fold hydrolase [Streptomyces sioyaensis]RXS71062.1 alpha/beta hydrolase [Streptomyces sioyaensis]